MSDGTTPKSIAVLAVIGALSGGGGATLLTATLPATADIQDLRNELRREVQIQAELTRSRIVSEFDAQLTALKLSIPTAGTRQRITALEDSARRTDSRYVQPTTEWYSSNGSPWASPTQKERQVP